MYIGESDRHVEGMVAGTTDVDEFHRLAQEWMSGERDGVYDAPMKILPPDFRWWRWVPSNGGDFELYLLSAVEGRPGAWPGALIRVEQDGCSLCTHRRGSHADGCLNGGVTGLVTLQFSGGKRRSGPLSETWIHAIRSRRPAIGRLGGTPGPTLCGFERFAPDSPGWSVGGGSYSPDVQYTGCYLCGCAAHDEFPGLSISGSAWFSRPFSETTGVPLVPSQTDADTPM
jgi:hypothetical protein